MNTSRTLDASSTGVTIAIKPQNHPKRLQINREHIAHCFISTLKASAAFAVILCDEVFFVCVCARGLIAVWISCAVSVSSCLSLHRHLFPRTDQCRLGPALI